MRSELRQGTDRILGLVTWAIVPTASLLVVSQMRSHESLAGAIRGTVAGVGAMIPEGLVLLTSIAFTAGVLRLSRRRVLVQELAAIEGLARVDVVCTDKTGTITELDLEVSELVPLDGVDRAEVEAALGALAAADPEPNASGRALAHAFASPGWAPTWRAAFSSARRYSGAGFGPHGDWIIGAPNVLLDVGAGHGDGGGAGGSTTEPTAAVAGTATAPTATRAGTAAEEATEADDESEAARPGGPAGRRAVAPGTACCWWLAPGASRGRAPRPPASRWPSSPSRSGCGPTPARRSTTSPRRA